MTTKTKFSTDDFIKNLDAIRIICQKCADDFANDPFKFIDEMANFIKKNKNHVSLAKKLNYPEPLVKHIISCMEIDFNDNDEWKLKKYIEKKTNGKFLNTNKEVPSKSDNFINIYLEDNKPWFWGDNCWFQIPSPFPIPEEYTTLYDTKVLDNFDITADGWQFSLRTENYGNKHYFSANSAKEKKEVLEMYRLMNKYLGGIGR